MANLILLGVFVAASAVLIALASRRQRRHGGSMRAEHGRLGLNEPPPEGRWFPGGVRGRHGMGRRRYPGR
jgi:hypothetical protein